LSNLVQPQRVTVGSGAEIVRAEETSDVACYSRADITCEPVTAMADNPHLLVHDRRDNVGVVIVENLLAGTNLLCVVTEDNSEFHALVRQDVPIGHKVALRDLAVGDTVIKYGQDIGRVVAAVHKGDHVHTHSLKTKRW
jgi:(2R)-sulfolactate sulfo-lyase subunit alpha